MKFEKIIDPIDPSLIIGELEKVGKLRDTRKGGNEIYCVNEHNAPQTLREIGRLREVTFREAGGGTGLSCDLDEYDSGPYCYDQLIVWSPEDQEIVGGYRYKLCREASDEQGEIHLSTSHYFDFSSKFVSDFLPDTIELGRSWVQPRFQPSVNLRKGLYSLDNIWDGLGGLVLKYPEIRYFFGKVTMYPSYNREARDFLLHFMHYYFPDKDRLMLPIQLLEQDYDRAWADEELKGLDFKEGFKVLNQYVRERGENVPPLVNIYMHLSPTMRTFGTAVNKDFGGVEETGILVTIDDIYQDKKERHITVRPES
ncbi:MAG: GNAT family N-acetyltransferase [Bacteroidetes bacterium]|nr:MAG: GNAT family N-acetyltransferase [Bacteroidota bacterium]